MTQDLGTSLSQPGNKEKHTHRAHKLKHKAHNVYSTVLKTETATIKATKEQNPTDRQEEKQTTTKNK